MTEILPVSDPAFAEYGAVWSNVDASLIGAIADALEAATPLPEATDYVPEDPAIQGLEAATKLAPALFGGLPVEFGWCNGHNLKLNCLEYHRTSEFNLGSRDFVLLLAKQSDIVDGKLDTACVKAFCVPAGVLVEVYATTLHYAPCNAEDDGFKVLVALPAGTNLNAPELLATCGDSELLWASNKWLLAHPESAEATSGAPVRLTGVNISM
ncbi:DUF4867 family protein [Paratractidigestivibacter sp.]|uniref:DUF4867 family protein n=1 Tax=Paratractidigestivibacter sp. TaxID=2847316 RepID=UPI002AC8AD7D|nr:DUF4867 family protein [Paratractidigestivibacter sp.]